MTYKQAALSFERDRNRRYLGELEEKSLHQERAAGAVSRSRSADWTGSGRPQTRDQIEVGPLIARVLLSEPDELLGQDFYIGPWFVAGSDTTVISWAAPAAADFYQVGHGASELNGVVRVRRLFISNIGGEIEDLYDSQVGNLNADVDPFPRQALRIPSPPNRTTGPERGSTAGRGAFPEQRSADAQAKPPVETVQHKLEPASYVDPSKRSNGPPRLELVAAEAVEAVVRRPRQRRLQHQLATIQPDQMDLVRRDPGVPLVIEGDPGTGKTVVASHRAAYLVNPEHGKSMDRSLQASAPGSQLPYKSVLLIGPNDEYAGHVGQVLRSLAPDGLVRTVGIDSLMAEIALLERVDGTLDGSVLDFDLMVLQLVDDVVDYLTNTDPAFGALDLRAARERVYEALRTNQVDQQRLSSDGDDIAWMRTLPRYKSATRSRRYLPLFAAIGAAVKPVRWIHQHVIIDEAQDVRPLEWAVLGRLNRGGWTILGDFNQRRSDHSPMSWDAVDHALRGADTTVLTSNPISLQNGYRSTQQIMRFAQRLLPSRDRNAQCVEVDGPEPTIIRAREAELGPAVIEAAGVLLGRYRQGTVAIISTGLNGTRNALIADGWERADGSQSSRWAKRGSEGESSIELSLLLPEHARGLEFDGVVVVEPAAYPKGLLGNGLLYTSLTRANKGLVVVHSLPLPDRLRVRRR